MMGTSVRVAIYISAPPIAAVKLAKREKTWGSGSAGGDSHEDRKKNVISKVRAKKRNLSLAMMPSFHRGVCQGDGCSHANMHFFAIVQWKRIHSYFSWLAFKRSRYQPQLAFEI